MIKKTTQQIAIPTILEVGKGNLDQVGEIVGKRDFTKAVVFFGKGIRELFGNRVLASFEKAGIQVLLQREHEENRLCELANIAFSLPVQTEIIIGVGGGKVIDVAKYIAFLTELPFVGIPTATSNDGFSSAGCSLYVNNRRCSVPAKMPYGIIVDIDVVKNAPEKLIYSGIGDLVSKITALYDWQFEEQHGKALVDDFAVMIGKKSVNSVVRLNFTHIREDLFLRELVDSLTMSGIAMEVAKNSAPASGSEHLISHAMDKLLERPYLHGIQVGIATYLMSKVQQHRYRRVADFLTTTGFFEHVKATGVKAAEIAAAIDLAPSIKPQRHTYLHLPEYLAAAKRYLKEDEILNDILV